MVLADAPLSGGEGVDFEIGWGSKDRLAAAEVGVLGRAVDVQGVGAASPDVGGVDGLPAAEVGVLAGRAVDIEGDCAASRDAGGVDGLAAEVVGLAGGAVDVEGGGTASPDVGGVLAGGSNFCGGLTSASIPPSSNS